MTAARKFIILIIVLLVLVAVLAFPRQTEQIAMLAEEGRHQEAIARLQRRLSDQPRNPDLLAALARSHVALGQYRRAIDSYDAYLTLRPHDLAARQRQIDLLLQSGLIDRSLDALARLVEAYPTTGQIARLAGLYRLHGRVPDELTTLQTYARRGLLEPNQLERLGALLAAQGHWHEARQWLEVEERKSPPSDSTGRLLLFEALIQSNDIDQACRYAEAWMATWRSSFLSGKLILRMAQEGLGGPASRLALRWQDLMPEATFEMVGLFVGKGHGELARLTLAQWVDRSPDPTEEQLRGLANASARLGDARLVIDEFLQLARSRTDPAMVAQFAEEVTNAFGAPVVAAIRPVLSTEALLARPLFAAKLSLSEGNHEAARWFLDQCDPNELTPEERSTWLGLLRRADTDVGALERLMALWSAGNLPADLVPELAEQALKTGRPETHDVIWRSIAR